MPVQDWTFPGEGTYPFVLPMHSNNFDLLAKRVRFDSNAMQQLRSAQQLALPGSCSEWASDSIYFQMDFGHAAPLVHTYRITWGQYDDRWHNPILCALIAPAGESRVYLFTQRAKAFPTDPVRPGSVLLLHTREGNRYWGLGRSCRMLAPGELQVETECWEYTPGHPKGDHFRVLHRVAITDSGLLRSAAVRSIRVPG
ncbi:MAG: hypothetical protein EOO12_03725 [Chitinophagaceae bacterium]|nr:MAG: hypothetical protein EOO12_03725 [Chitinophagaceae bacterium]